MFNPLCAAELSAGECARRRDYHVSLSIDLQITQLKIDNNPFAKGFRDCGGSRRDNK